MEWETTEMRNGKEESGEEEEEESEEIDVFGIGGRRKRARCAALDLLLSMVLTGWVFPSPFFTVTAMMKTITSTKAACPLPPLRQIAILSALDLVLTSPDLSESTISLLLPLPTRRTRKPPLTSRNPSPRVRTLGFPSPRWRGKSQSTRARVPTAGRGRGSSIGRSTTRKRR